MFMKQYKFSKIWAPGLLLIALLQGCGGGGSSASNTATPQVANGLVTGFGSVFVDGVEIEDANASVVTENMDGSTTNSVLQMGQRIRVDHDGKGTASKVTVDASVIGKVSNADTNAGTLTVAGQSITTNTDASVGPVTVWAGGYTGIADIVVNTDYVEVHGTPVYDSVNHIYKVAASRIQKLALVSTIKVSGKISNINTGAKTFSLNGLTVNYANAILRPASVTALINDMVVSVFGPTSNLSGTTLTATNLKVNRLQDSNVSNTVAQVGGQVSNYDAGAKTFEVQGVTIQFNGSTVVGPLASSTVANNAYVKVSGTVGNDGSITATNIQVREQNTNSDLAKVKLKGVISDFVNSSSFVVRGVPVDASNITTTDPSCQTVTLANGVSVQITATQQSNTPVVLATSLICQAGTDIVIRPKDGVASAVDTTAKTFVLTPSGESAITVQWNDKTTFVGVTAESLNTTQVRVEGYFANANNTGNFVARVVRAQVSPPVGQGGQVDSGLDDDRFMKKANGDNSGSSWTSYRNTHPAQRRP
jgi:hypothetical protein